MKSKWVVAVVALSALLWIIACEGPEGPKGDSGPQGPGFPEFTYLGDDANTCNHCHDQTVATWSETGHHEAYETLVAIGQADDPYCVQCHVTGWDAAVEYEGEEPVITPGPDLYGADDYWPPLMSADSLRFAMLKNVQCEACHGPMGPTIYDHAPVVNFNTGLIDDADPSMCAQCHEQVEEWQESGHGSVLESHGMTMQEFNEEWNTFSSCWECHTGEGYANRYDLYWAAEGRPEQAHLIGCQACHDPHDATNDHQLRSLDEFSVLYDAEQPATFAGYGGAQTCAQCHHARRDNDDVTEQIQDGDDHFGPHPSPQIDMFLGTGSYEIAGFTYDRFHNHQNIEDACVTCHMEMRGHDDPLGWKGGHDFEASATTCATAGGCHLAADPTFNYGNVVESVNTKLDELITLIGVDPEELGDPEITSPEERMAGYAYMFVLEDGSHGVHNPTYALDLLDNAIDFMQTINAQRAGLITQK